jgi:quercetin dioxygenase-like cupin family protein
MEIKRSGSESSVKGPPDWFTGMVPIDPLFSPPDPSQVAGALVTFEPGARTALARPAARPDVDRNVRLGWVQREGGPVQEIRPGDVVWFSPAEKHWHGASPTAAMSHIAIQEKQNGSPVIWLEHVTDEPRISWRPLHFGWPVTF